MVFGFQTTNTTNTSAPQEQEGPESLAEVERFIGQQLELMGCEVRKTFSLLLCVFLVFYFFIFLFFFIFCFVFPVFAVVLVK